MQAQSCPCWPLADRSLQQEITVVCAPFRSQGKYVEAESLYERSQAIREQTMGVDHPDVAIVLNNRADLLEKQVWRLTQ